jgi:hypothetical protein
MAAPSDSALDHVGRACAPAHEPQMNGAGRLTLDLKDRGIRVKLISPGPG